MTLPAYASACLLSRAWHPASMLHAPVQTSLPPRQTRSLSATVSYVPHLFITIHRANADGTLIGCATGKPCYRDWGICQYLFPEGILHICPGWVINWVCQG